MGLALMLGCSSDSVRPKQRRNSQLCGRYPPDLATCEYSLHSQQQQKQQQSLRPPSGRGSRPDRFLLQQVSR